LKKNLLLIVLFIAIIFFGRILPHPYNFTPLIAVTLLSSYSLSNKFLAIMIPLVGFWISDLFMNNYIYAGYFTDFTVFNSGMIWTYGAIVLVALMGSSFLNKISTGKVVLASLSGSTIFYLISNFGVWAFSPMYAKTLTGLVQCYSLALPFYGTSLMGDLVYSALLFGAYQLVFSKNPNFLTSQSKT
jgi:hypothetical protein